MPIPVKSRPRFKCQFCLSYKATLPAVEKHEGFCWQNPGRYCKECENTGEVDQYRTWVDNFMKFHLVFVGKKPCRYCSKEEKAVTASLRKS